LTSDLKTPAFGLAFFLVFDNGVWPVVGVGPVFFWSSNSLRSNILFPAENRPHPYNRSANQIRGPQEGAPAGVPFSFRNILPQPSSFSTPRDSNDAFPPTAVALIVRVLSVANRSR
jgi:hypothetical protein